jgi:CHAD domain-containing protein
MNVAPEHTQQVFKKLERDLLRLASKQTPERVHKLRTGTRRVETLLKELTPERSRNEKKLLKLLGAIRKRAGKVRDLDVQLAALRSLKIPQQPRRKTQLTQELIELRAEQENKLTKTLTKATVREIRKRLRRTASDWTPEASRDPLAVAKQMLEPVANPKAPLTEDVLHRYRILGKRARYAAEFAPASPEVERFMTQLKRVQDAVGHWHDWLTLTQTAAKRLGDVHESPLVAVLHNVTGAKFRNAVAALPKVRAAEDSTDAAFAQQAGPQKRQVKKSSTQAVSESTAA